jgi:hypothetical protein
LKVAKFQFEIVAKDELILPEYKGSTFRGSLGHALKKVVCITRKNTCTDCLLKDKCAYSYIFETRNERGEQVPHPFVIEPPMTGQRLFPPGQSLFFNLILMGNAIDYIPYLIYAFREVGRSGIGRNHGVYWIKKVNAGFNGVSCEIYNYHDQILSHDYPKIEISEISAEDTDKITLHFISPTALKINGYLTLNIDAEMILKAIIRRIKSLSQYHNQRDEEFFNIDWSGLNKVTLKELDIEWYKWQKYSGRQDCKIDFDGFVGKLTLTGSLKKLMPWLRIGELLHIGRGTVYGMGQYLLM